MRRTLFYLSVALLVCGLIINFQKTLAQTNYQTVNYQTEKGENVTLPCENENIRLVWSKIKNQFTDSSSKTLADYHIKNCSDMFEAGKGVDLNNDHQQEIIVHQIAECPASGNCMFWIFQKKQKGYQAILNADEIQLYELRKTRTAGYGDIKLSTQNSATSQYQRLFKFDGKKYTAQKCWWEDYTYLDRKGNQHELKKPQIHYEKCGEYDYVN